MESEYIITVNESVRLVGECECICSVLAVETCDRINILTVTINITVNTGSYIVVAPCNNKEIYCSSVGGIERICVIVAVSVCEVEYVEIITFIACGH